MINLLPPDLKEQITYAKFNKIVVHYVRLTVVIAIVLAAIMVGSFYYLNLEVAAAQSNVTAKQQTIAQYKSTILPKATDASNRLNAIAYVQETQTHFSKLISDLSLVIPQGVALNTMSLTGNAAAPVQISVDSQTYDEVLALKNALLTSPRVQAVDITSIIQLYPAQYGYNFQSILVIAFKPGEAK
jgi:Tfp pilus assembly protein PilN